MKRTSSVYEICKSVLIGTEVGMGWYCRALAFSGYHWEPTGIHTRQGHSASLQGPSPSLCVQMVAPSYAGTPTPP